MRLLIDTHALIWWWDEDRKLSPTAQGELTDRRNVVFVSAASGWEMATKVRAGRLPSMAPRIAHFDQSVRGDGFEHLDVRYDHGVKGGLLPGVHRDPFDRLLAAQALIDGLTVVTCDRQLAAFGCKVLW